MTCFLYSEEDCTGERSAPLVNPGSPDLKTVEFAKKGQSWQCWKWCGWMGPSSSSFAAAGPSESGSMSAGMQASTVSPSSSSFPQLFPRLVSITTTIDASATTAQTATTAPGLMSTTLSAPSSAAPTKTTAASSQAEVFETSMSSIVFTHTYADGSVETITSPLADPVAVTPASAPQNAGGAVSLTATEGEVSPAGPALFTTPGATENETLKAPAPMTTPEAASGVSITTTLSVTESAAASASEGGVEITTTQGVASVRTLTSEGVTVPVPTEVSFSSSGSAFSAPSATSTEDEPQGWKSLVTLTGVDATLTVTATGGPAASPTS